MPRKLYLDESGDLGWKFDSPYRSGGSSITSTASGDIYVYQSNRLSPSCIMSSHNGVLKITDTLATINELIKSYKILDSL